MSSVTRPRGPLPPRVYWTRRVLVLGVAMLLVLGIGKVLGGGSDAKEDDPRAEIVSGSPTPDTEPRTPADSSESKPKRAKKKHKVPKPPPLPEPTGPCDESDVVVTPVIDDARAGGDVTIVLEFTTKVSEACTFAVSSESIVLRLTSGDDKIWSSQQCPQAIPNGSVTARKEVAGTLAMTWRGHRSNDGCTVSAPWALPGYYHAEAAALGGDPTDVQFRLSLPERPTITPKPKVKKPKRNG